MESQLVHCNFRRRRQRLPLGPLMDFGYENEVLFPFNLDVASSAKPGPVALHAKVAWLVCRGALHSPGKAEPSKLTAWIAARRCLKLPQSRRIKRFTIVWLAGFLSRCPRPITPSSNRVQQVFVLRSLQGSARRRPFSFLKIKTSSTIPRRRL